jgi:predicted protein tyrosine phosphatase
MIESSPIQLPKIAIASYREACQLLSDQSREGTIKHIISIGSPGELPPPGYDGVPYRLRLEFDDTVPPGFDDTIFSDEEDEYIVATPDDIAKVIDFVPLILQDSGVTLIHCQAGISRSAAVGLIIYAILFDSGKENEALLALLKSRPMAIPNTWVVQLADEALERGGKLVEVAQIHEKFVLLS